MKARKAIGWERKQCKMVLKIHVLERFMVKNCKPFTVKRVGTLRNEVGLL